MTIVEGYVQFHVGDFPAQLVFRLFFIVAVGGVFNGCNTTINLCCLDLFKFMQPPEEVVVVVLCFYLVFSWEDFDFAYIVVVVAFLTLDELLLLDVPKLQVLDANSITSASTFLYQFL